MNALSLWQPWASAIALGIKTAETRSWPAPARAFGRIAIHAAKTDNADVRKFWQVEVARKPEVLDHFARTGIVSFEGLPFGAVVATARVIACVSTNEEPPRILYPTKFDRFWGDFSLNRFVWFLADVERVDPPVPTIGRQGLFNWEPLK